MHDLDKSVYAIVLRARILPEHLPPPKSLRLGIFFTNKKNPANRPVDNDGDDSVECGAKY